ncbi:SET domain-containing protein-lysine N-methyltransferase [Sphingomonas donggukensis]|uniref:SET domain-containing protein-lysine N-methyltransferase n=1 Tax=Sphingomonas donggukensis TaxID=2949093 RepID=A0ABY4TWZ7_9SPHN|nr:SET domain-containing protein-lysine N-methyltransferase [Sphingomonas donggukensis]URW76928.1 SET domain-containing protein-lysine N-methyltransferase [Sphingomonas donggukensis]
MGVIEPWFVVAVAGNFAGYAIYLAGLRRNLVEPNRASWLIWSAATGMEAATYAAVNPGALQGIVILVSAIACVAVTFGIWRRAAWAAPSPTETLCVAACLSALVLWLVFREAYWAHMLVVAAVPVSFLPTWASVRADPARERSPAWGLWTLGDLATLLVAARGGGEGAGQYAYLLVEFLCHASVWFMIGLATINPLRSFGRRRGGFYVLDAYRKTASLFAVGDTHLGKAVFAAVPFAEGQPLLEFTGRRFRAAQVPSLMRGAGDRYVQVTPDHYMGPSGRMDDLVNHSCDPNAGLRFADDGVYLVAIRAIAPGEEISWDYSTTLTESNWHMICQCRSPDCRRVIGNFATLAPERQEFYRARNLVAPYLRRRESVLPDVRRHAR